MKKLWHIFVVAVVLPASTAVSLAQLSPRDYSQWRGNTRDGSASAFEVPRSWPETLTRRWKVEVGEGYATPLVIGDIVYTFTRRGDEEVIAALDAASGAERWHTN